MEIVAKLQTTLKNNPKIVSLAFTGLLAGSQFFYHVTAASINSGP